MSSGELNAIQAATVVDARGSACPGPLLEAKKGIVKVKVGEREVEYGYSSGIYTKHVSKSTPIQSVPYQEAIDALGGGTSRPAWDARFELALEQCRERNVTLVGGDCQTALEFGRYLRSRHKVYPKQLWKTQVMTFCRRCSHRRM